MTDIADRLARALHDAVAARFDGLQSAASGSTRLLFAAVGRPVDPQQFALPTPSAVLEETSTFVDCLPEPGTDFLPGTGTFSDAYDSLLDVARPRAELPDDVRETVATQLADARRRFDATLVGRLSAPVTYAPTAQDPERWFDPAGSHWTHLSVSEQSGPVADPPPPGPVPSPAPPPWQFRLPARVANLDEWVRRLPPRKLEVIQPVDRGIVASQPLRLSALQVAAAPRLAPALRRRIDDDPVVEGPDPVIRRPPLAAVRLLGRAEVLQDLVADSTAVPATSSGFSLDLDYCLVTLRRLWMLDAWLAGDDWCVPGMDPGAVSAGDPAASGQQIPAIPLAYVVVKDVVIRASWSGPDAQAVTGAAGLGPFVMAGAGFAAESGTLSIPGVQAIACLCEVPPVLPPPPAS